MPSALGVWTMLIWTALAVYAGIVIVAGQVAPATYSILANTVSDLGSQGFPSALLMRSGFVVLGLASIVAAIQIGSRADGLARPLIIASLGTYGIAILLTGIFSAAPFGSDPSNLEARVHSVCAQIAGVAFLGGIAAVASRAGGPVWFGWFSGAAFVLIMVFSVLFFASDGLQGIWQRGLQATSLIWLAVASR